MSAWARVGAKCVCVDASPSRLGEVNLKVSAIYTITERVETSRNGVGVNLAGVSCRLSGFHIWRFRPLVTNTQEQDVAMFTPLLSKKEIPA